MFYSLIFTYFLLLKLLISSSNIHTYQNVLTLIGDKNVTHRSGIMTQSFSKISIYGPFYCHVIWTDNKQTIDISTDDNIHPYVIVNIERDTLKITIQSDVNLKYTEMNIYLNLNPIIKEIFLAGISIFYSINVLNINHLLKLRTEDTSSLILQLIVSNLDALFLSAGTTELTGQVKDTALIKYNGIGDVDASQLFCKFVDIDANGLGTVWITGTDECIIKAEGMSIIKYNCYNINRIQVKGLARVIPV